MYMNIAKAEALISDKVWEQLIAVVLIKNHFSSSLKFEFRMLASCHKESSKPQGSWAVRLKSYYIGLTRVLSTKLQQTVRLQMKSAMIYRSTPLNITKLVGIFSITRFVTSFADTRPRIMLPTERARNTSRNILKTKLFCTYSSMHIQSSHCHPKPRAPSFLQP